MRYLHILSAIVVTSLMTQCAKVTTPSGGTKDTIPPLLIKSWPENRQLNFNENTIELSFDEAIQVNNPREQILITPTIGKKFELEARKNRAILKLNAEPSLLENTTYTIAFRDAIQDLTERNPAVNLKLAFSTGNYIDSLSIQGKVYDLFKGDPVKNFVVAVAPYHDTLNIFKHSAQWITLTNDKGVYSIENLKAGTYLIYAFEDANKNLVVDSRSERHGFKATPIQLDSSITGIDIPVINLDTRDLKLISAKPIGRYVNIRTTKGLATYSLKHADPDSAMVSLSEDPSTIRVYNTFPDKDSLMVHFTAKDSIDNRLDTLFYIKFEKRSTGTENFTLKIDPCDYYQNRTNLQAIIKFNKPVTNYLYDSVHIQLDSVNYVRFTSADFTWSTDHTQLILTKKLSKEIDFTRSPLARPPGQPIQERPVRRPSPGERPPVEPKTDQPEKSYNQLAFPTGTFISVENDTSTSTSSAIRTLTPESTGVIIVEAQTTKSILIQLTTKSGEVVASSTQPKARFDNLNPGDYFIRVVTDSNSNGKWDAGNFFLKKEPEPILYYRNEAGQNAVNIKANWELGPLLITLE